MTARPPSAPSPDRPTVLAVDDEPSLLEGLGLALRRQPYRLLTAAGAAEALATLEREPVDVILTDLQMPGTSGHALLAACRERFPAVVRIALTGHPGAASAIQAINEGRVFLYLTKPFAREALLEALAAACASRAAERERERLAARSRAEAERRLPRPAELLTAEEREALREVLGPDPGSGGGGEG